MLLRSALLAFCLGFPLVGCASLLGLDDDASDDDASDDDADTDAGSSRPRESSTSGGGSSGGGASSGQASSSGASSGQASSSGSSSGQASSSGSSSGQASSSGGSGGLPDTALWPLAVGRVWTFTGGSGANGEVACQESYTVTGFGAFEGKDAYEVTVDWCDLVTSTEHYAPGDVDQMFRWVDGAWVLLFQGPVDYQESFLVGSARHQWTYGVRPPGFSGGDTGCWRLMIPLSSTSPLLEFCRGLGLVRVMRNEFDNSHDVDVTLTSVTP